jgi:hypothetical protein
MVGRLQAPVGQSGLRGRAEECGLLDDLVSAIRRGESRSLLLQGEAGMGKTALLEHLIASASDLTRDRRLARRAGRLDRGPRRAELPGHRQRLRRWCSRREPDAG